MQELSDNSNKDSNIDIYYEPKSGNGCSLNHHIELTRGKPRFQPTVCDRCGQEVYPA